MHDIILLCIAIVLPNNTPQGTTRVSLYLLVLHPPPPQYSIMTASNSNSNGAAPASSSTPWGTGLTQADLMEKDTVLVLDNADAIIGTASKKESHVFSTKQPHGILHRAFSVFLFDESDGRMLLQQRASTKITFPNVCHFMIIVLYW
jgi:hypothetical protein